MRDLYADSYYTVTLDETQGLVRATRSSERFSDIATAEASMKKFEGALSSLDRSSLRLLVDMRAAHARNDPEFEKMMNRWVTRIFTPFAARAVLVKTAVGRLQIQRTTRTQMSLEIFGDEQKALEYLSSAAPTRSGAPPKR